MSAVASWFRAIDDPARFGQIQLAVDVGPSGLILGRFELFEHVIALQSGR
jgi:hypothetical protein